MSHILHVTYHSFSTVLQYSCEIRVLYLSVLIFCWFIYLLHFGNILEILYFLLHYHIDVLCDNLFTGYFADYQ